MTASLAFSKWAGVLSHWAKAEAPGPHVASPQLSLPPETHLAVPS